MTNDPKDTTYKVRFDKATIDKLSFISEKTGMTRAEIIRRGIDKLYEELSGEN